ncbi:MAG: DEAD/DEAH box helicase [Bacteroidota bacterium]
MKFSDFNFEEHLQQGLEAIGFEKPTEIQEKAIPQVLDKKDLIGCAQTGTGKTAAFLLPIIEDVLRNGHNGLIALVIVPTRELAIQIDQQVEGLGYFTGVSSLAIYGGKDGVSFGQEKQALIEGADIVIATPGRLIAHLNLGYVQFKNIRFLVLDEADRMLDMGFSEDIEKIVGHLPEKRNNLLFSATMPPNIRKLAKTILTDPVEINIALSKPAKGVVQAAFPVYETQKPGLIIHLLKSKPLSSVIVFCSTRKSVTILERVLKKEKIKVGSISSDLDQKQREAVMIKFKSGGLNVLVATNIVARGIDIVGIELVINYDVPRDAEDYVHRIGRTARADAKGIAFTFISEEEQRDFHDIERLIETEVKKISLPSHLGGGPKYNPKTHYKKRSFKAKTKRKR